MIATVAFSDLAMTKIHTATVKFSPAGYSKKHSVLSEENGKIPPLLFSLPLLGEEGKGIRSFCHCKNLFLLRHCEEQSDEAISPPCHCACPPYCMAEGTK